jgi:signal transduction histidine kinase
MTKKWAIFLFFFIVCLVSKSQQKPFLLGFSMPEIEKMFIQKQFFNSPILPDSLSDCEQIALIQDLQLLFDESITTLIEKPTKKQSCERPFDLWIKQISDIELDTSAILLAKNLLLKNAQLHESYKAIGLIELSKKLISVNQFPKALVLLQESINLIDKNPNELINCLSYLTFINLFHAQQETKNELKYLSLLNESPIISDSRYLTALELQLRSNLQMSYKNPELDSALSYELKALEIYQLLGLPEQIATTYNSLGSNYEEKDDYAKSISYYNKALKYHESVQDSISMSYLYNNIGTLYQVQKKYVEALSYFQQATNILERKDANNAYLYVFYLNLAEALEALGEYEKSLHYFKKFDQLEYDRINQDQKKEIAKLQEKYDAKGREREIREMSLFAELQKLNLEKTTLQRNWVIGITLLALFFAWSIIRSIKLAKQKEVLKLKQGIFEKNQKMTLLTLKNESETTKALSVGQDSERKRIAIYLHDHFGNSMGALKMHAENIAKTTKLGVKKTQEVNMLVSLIESTNKELRSLSHELTDNSSASFKLSENIERMCNSFNVSEELSVIYRCVGSNLLSTHVALEFYRICQEALTNALKYSKANKIIVNLTDDAMGVNLSIIDNGIGMSISGSEASKGNGFANMRNRARSIHAAFNVTSSPNEGTSININLPFQKSK